MNKQSISVHSISGDLLIRTELILLYYNLYKHKPHTYSIPKDPLITMSSFNLTQKAPIISIEGNIGSGKSTLMIELKKSFEHVPNVVFLQEPVDEWNTIRDEKGMTMIEKFYADQTKYSFSFQMMAYISRLATVRKAIRENPNSIFISERCLHTDKYVFAKMLFDDHKIESVDYQIYNKWFDTFIEDFEITNLVYIKTNPDVCLERIAKRGRDGEGHIPIEYLTTCGEYHDNMMKEMKCDIDILDGNVNNSTNPNHVKSWVYRINTIVSNLTENIKKEQRSSSPSSGSESDSIKHKTD